MLTYRDFCFQVDANNYTLDEIIDNDYTPSKLACLTVIIVLFFINYPNIEGKTICFILKMTTFALLLIRFCDKIIPVITLQEAYE